MHVQGRRGHHRATFPDRTHGTPSVSSECPFWRGRGVTNARTGKSGNWQSHPLANAQWGNQRTTQLRRFSSVRKTGEPEGVAGEYPWTTEPTPNDGTVCCKCNRHETGTSTEQEGTRLPSSQQTGNCAPRPKAARPTKEPGKPCFSVPIHSPDRPAEASENQTNPRLGIVCFVLVSAFLSSG